MPNTLGAGLGNIPFPSTTIYPETVDTGYPNALMIRGWCTGVPSDTTATRYAPGAMLTRTDASVGTTNTYVNAGTAASPSWVGLPFQVATSVFGIVSVVTNGTTAVNVFGATNPFAGTLTGFFGIARDTTASTITLATNDTASIASFAKSATLGVMTGATMTIATAFTYGGTMTVVSSGSGNVTAYATFIR